MVGLSGAHRPALVGYDGRGAIGVGFQAVCRIAPSSYVPPQEVAVVFPVEDYQESLLSAHLGGVHLQGEVVSAGCQRPSYLALHVLVMLGQHAI